MYIKQLLVCLAKNATRYGKFEYPFMLAINIDAMVCENIDECNALFGEEYLGLDWSWLKK